MIGEQFASGLEVLIVCDGKRDPAATQIISFCQPFERASGHPQTRVSFEKDYADPNEIEKAFASREPNLLVLSRYTSERGQDWIRLARTAGIPVIFHIDDDLLAVPASLGEAKFNAYNNPERLSALRANIAHSDLLYVSTPELARRFKEYRIGTPIVAGEIYCSVDPNAVGNLLPPATGPVIGYMGTSGHSADLGMIMPAICQAMDSISGLQFEVFGTIGMPSELSRFGSRVRHIAPVADYPEFLARLRSLGWWIGLAPLEDNQFNRCKADTKWVEYSMAGMAVVASDLPVYHRACADGAGVLAGTTEGWANSIKDLLYRPCKRTQFIKRAQEKLIEGYTHESLRAQVMAIFDQALKNIVAKAGAT